MFLCTLGKVEELESFLNVGRVSGENSPVKFCLLKSDPTGGDRNKNL